MLKTYAYHKPSVAAIDRIDQIREAYSNLHSLLNATAPLSRELSVALTNLETSAMWAIKAVVINDPDSESNVENPIMEVPENVKKRVEELRYIMNNAYLTDGSPDHEKRLQATTELNRLEQRVILSRQKANDG